MENGQVPIWAQELRAFTEFTIGRLEERVMARIDGIDGRLNGLDDRVAGFENRVTRKIDTMGTHIDGRIDIIQSDVATLKKARDMP